MITGKNKVLKLFTNNVNLVRKAKTNDLFLKMGFENAYTYIFKYVASKNI